MSGRRLGRLLGSLLVLATIRVGPPVTGVQAIDGGCADGGRRLDDGPAPR